MLPRNSVRFSCTALAGTSKQGRLPKDKDGYYVLPVGGLNVFNSAGEYYTAQGARELFQGSSPLMRRIQSGCLKSEYGHPRMERGQSMDEFAARVMRIDEKTTCAHIQEVWLDLDNALGQDRNTIPIMAKITPSGPMGPALAASLENMKEDVCFSIRAFTEDNWVRGVKQRTLREVVTWDYVHEPGLNLARKYAAPALEDFKDADVEFTKENLMTTLPAIEGLAMESTQASGLNVMRALGWDIDRTQLPRFLSW